MTINKTPLRPFLAPSGIALFGASPVAGTVGHGLVRSLTGGPWASRTHFINPRHQRIGERPCVASLDQIAASLSLALIATPMDTVIPIIEACGRRGIESAVVYATGGMHDPGQHTELKGAAARAKVRLIGPRSMGFVLPHADFNATPIPKSVPMGNLGFVTQSNSICAGILDWSHNNEFGFSAVFCPGEGADLELPEIVDYLATDVHTESILLYLEGVRDARRFMSALRAAASVKPVIAVKAGQHPYSVRVAARHSGGAIGDDDAFDAALRRAGVLRVKSIGDMFSAARALSNPCKPRGNRLAIVSNGGGPIVMAADCAAELAVELPAMTQATITRLASVVPSTWSAGNPVDVLFDTSPERFVGALSACLDDPNVDGVLAVLSPNSFVDTLALAHATITTAQQASKPLLSCWLGEMEARPARAAFARARIPTFRSAESAVAGFSFVANWVRNQALLQETPAALSTYLPPDTDAARRVISRALAEHRQALRPEEVRAVLRAFHVPAPDPQRWQDHTDGPDLPRLSMATRTLHLAIRPDAVFGPVITLSEGGAAANVYRVGSTALPPLNPRLVAEMTGEPAIARLLGPLGDSPAVAQDALHGVLLRLSELASELPCLHALDIRALRADDQGAQAYDLAMTVRETPADGARYRHMAICPYPTQFVGAWTLKDGSTCTVRPIRPEDADALQDFVRCLSARSKYYRFFNMINELPQRLLARYTQIDYARELTLVATATRPDGSVVMLGEANYSILSDGSTCEFALVVADQMAGKGLGARLMTCLMDAARLQGLKRIQGEVLADNEAMLGLMEALDFDVFLTDEGLSEVSRAL